MQKWPLVHLIYHGTRGLPINKGPIECKGAYSDSCANTKGDNKIVMIQGLPFFAKVAPGSS